MWTNREATQLDKVPGRALVVGGGPAGLELGQMLSRFGCQVTLVQSADRLIDREEPRVGELIGHALADDGVDVRLGRRVATVAAVRDGATLVELDDGTTLDADVVVLGAGRSPRMHDLGLDTVGIAPRSEGVAVDDRCQVAPGLWAVGDAEIAAVGLTEAQARERGHDVATAAISLPDAIARPWTYARGPSGELGLLADRRSRILLGA